MARRSYGTGRLYVVVDRGGRASWYGSWWAGSTRFGTQMAAAGAPLRAIQEWMGHADASTTEIYAHYAPDPTGGAAFAQRAFGSGTAASGQVGDAVSGMPQRAGLPQPRASPLMATAQALRCSLSSCMESTSRGCKRLAAAIRRKQQPVPATAGLDPGTTSDPEGCATGAACHPCGAGGGAGS